MDEQDILVVMVPLGQRDAVVDALITCTQISGFSMSEAAGFSREHSDYNLHEQVAGYRKFCRVEVLHRTADRSALCRELATVSGGEAWRYWVSPVQEQGHIGGHEPGPEESLPEPSGSG